MMIDILADASNNLCRALDQYLNVCDSIRKPFVTMNTVKSLPEELANRIRIEAQLLLNYESKLHEAKSAILWTRNSSALAPASTLPPETLSRIFLSVLEGESCSKQIERSITYTLNPKRLLHVCSRWRQIALSTPALWVHIDLSPSSHLNDKLLPRAKAYVERSGRLPLHIHFQWPSQSQLGLPDDPRVIEFIASIAARTGGLELDMYYQYADFHSQVLEICLKGCIPGVFTGLFVRKAGDARSQFSQLIQTNGSQPEDTFRGQPLLLDIPQQHLLDVLSRSTTLILDGMLVPWANEVYHNLVELRLFSSDYYTGRRSFITEAQLHRVLRLCPQLRTLESDLEIDEVADTGPVEYIRLNHLTTLALGGDADLWEVLLRSIAPGPNPLHLSLDWEHQYYPGEIRLYSMTEEFTNFCTRSNITKLTLMGSDTFAPAFAILQYTTNVQELVLDEVCWNMQLLDDTPDLEVQVNALYVLRSHIYLDDLRMLVETVNVQKLILWGSCSFVSDERFTLDAGGQGVQKELIELCSVVEFLGDDVPKPMGSRS